MTSSHQVGATGVASSAAVTSGVATPPGSAANTRSATAALEATPVAPTWWLLVAGHLVFGLTLAAVCARLARWRRALGHAGVLVVAVLAAWAGTVVLLSAVISSV